MTVVSDIMLQVYEEKMCLPWSCVYITAHYLKIQSITSLLPTFKAFFCQIEKKKIEILVICFPYDWRPGAHLFVFFDDEREEPNKRCNNLITTTYENDNDNT